MTDMTEIISIIILIIALFTFILVCFMAYIVIAGRKKFSDTNAMIANFLNRPPKV
jgi:uncharacterized membrane protein